MTLELKKRILTGLLGGLLLLAVILFARRFGIFLFVSVISLGMIFEFTEMIFSLPDKVEKRYVLLSLTWFTCILSFLVSFLEYSVLVFLFLFLFSYFLFTAKRYMELDYARHFKELAYSLFGLIYLVFIPQFFLRLAELDDGIKWVILFLVIVFTVDTGAYFVGTKYGRRRLYPVISPKKSVEGLAGGLVASLVVTLIYKLIIFRNMPWVGVLFIPPIVGLVAQLGDLCESFLKRSFQRKDSGNILPGHGGLLDRFDAVIFSLPIMYACVKIMG